MSRFVIIKPSARIDALMRDTVGLALFAPLDDQVRVIRLFPCFSATLAERVLGSLSD
jgi:hypothetical protein